jgi:hypothetical protein
MVLIVIEEDKRATCTGDRVVEGREGGKRRWARRLIAEEGRTIWAEPK